MATTTSTTGGEGQGFNEPGHHEQETIARAVSKTVGLTLESLEGDWEVEWPTSPTTRDYGNIEVVLTPQGTELHVHRYDDATGEEIAIDVFTIQVKFARREATQAPQAEESS